MTSAVSLVRNVSTVVALLSFVLGALYLVTAACVQTGSVVWGSQVVSCSVYAYPVSQVRTDEKALNKVQRTKIKEQR
jgi:hypothetical protein